RDLAMCSAVKRSLLTKSSNLLPCSPQKEVLSPYSYASLLVPASAAIVRSTHSIRSPFTKQDECSPQTSFTGRKDVLIAFLHVQVCQGSVLSLGFSGWSN